MHAHFRYDCLKTDLSLRYYIAGNSNNMQCPRWWLKPSFSNKGKVDLVAKDTFLYFHDLRHKRNKVRNHVLRGMISGPRREFLCATVLWPRIPRTSTHSIWREPAAEKRLKTVVLLVRSGNYTRLVPQNQSSYGQLYSMAKGWTVEMNLLYCLHKV